MAELSLNVSAPRWRQYQGVGFYTELMSKMKKVTKSKLLLEISDHVQGKDIYLLKQVYISIINFKFSKQMPL